MMGERSSESDLFNELANEFAERYRRGERPSLTEYTERHPELADEIRDLFPPLVMMEKLGGGSDRSADRVTGRFQPCRPIPDRLGDFRIIREIGRGGMGIVYEAEQESLGRHVALKVLSHPRHLGPTQLIRFQREARAAALLHHTNIVPVFGVGVHEDVHYYAMQFIEGQSLDSLLRELTRLRRDAVQEKSIPHLEPDSILTSVSSGLLRNRSRVEVKPSVADASPIVPSPTAPTGALTGGAAGAVDADSLPINASSSSLSTLGQKEPRYFRSVARLGMQVAEALAYAHSHGVVHRDIKPANLLLDLQGTIWVTDFGLAKAEGSEELTSPGDVVGTLRYMAPERFQGKAYSSSDIYSLGLTLYEMLTLKPAFTSAHRVQLLNSIIHVEPARPRKLERQIPRDLETIVLKAIAKNPDDRFASAGEMARELGRFVSGRPIHSRRASMPERLWRWSRRNPAVALLTLLAASLTTVLAIGSTVAAWNLQKQRDAVRNEQQKTSVELGRSLLRQVRALRYSREPAQREARLGKLAEAAKAARQGMAEPGLLNDLRDEAISTLAEVDQRPIGRFSRLNFNLMDSSFSFNADRYVVVNDRTTMHLHRISDQSEIRVVKPSHAQALISPALLPGGRFVIVGAGPSRTELWDLELGEVPAVWPADIQCATYRPDGKQVATLRPDGEVRIYDLPAMKEVSRCHLGLSIPSRLGRQQLALSADGRSLAVLRNAAPNARVYDLASGRLVLEVKVPAARTYGSVSLSRTGRLLAVAHDLAISVYDVTDGELLALLQGHQSAGINLCFEPEGDLLVSDCWDGITRVWDPIQGRLLAALQGNFRGWAETTSKLVVGLKDDLILHQVTLAQERRTIDCRTLREAAAVPFYGLAKLAFSPDGTMIAMTLRPDGVRILRASDGQGLALLPIGECTELLFLPDGALLTANSHGLCRWPVRPLSKNALRIGPPDPLIQLSRYGNQVELAAGASGRLVGFGALRESSYVLMNSEQRWRRSWLCLYTNIVGLAISPDGRWAATTDWKAYLDQMSLKVWQTATGQLKAEYPVSHSYVAFSPDGQWLGANGPSGVQFFRTGSWAKGARADCEPQRGWIRVAFHPSSRMAAIIDTGRSGVHLVHVETGRRIASFEGTDDSAQVFVGFSLDGRFLHTSHADQRVNLWDLASIRRRLEQLGLATGIPDLFDVSRAWEQHPPIDRIEVVGADPAGIRLLALCQTLREVSFAIRGLLDSGLTDPEELFRRGDFWARLGQWRLAATDYRTALVRRPDARLTATDLAASPASAPGRGIPDEAVYWARLAVRLQPGNAHYRRSLCSALYRAGRFAEAALELERQISRNSETLGDDWLLLAMCKHRLGQVSSARNALGQALRWDGPVNWWTLARTAVFHSLLKEAQAVLDEPIPELPADVFGG
jgi:serine/threonine protein kinase